MGLHKTKKRGQAPERSVEIFMMVAGVLPFFFSFSHLSTTGALHLLSLFSLFPLRYHIVSQHN